MARFVRMAWGPVLLLLVVSLFAVPHAGTRVHAGEDVISVNIGDEDVLIEDFLRVIARATKTPLVWNPSDKNIRGKKIIGSLSMKAPRKELFELVRSLLTFYELVLIPVGPPGHQIQLVMDARQLSSILKLKPEPVLLTDENLADYEHKDGKFLSAVIRVEHMTDLRFARNALTRVVTGQNIGSVVEVPAARAFLVTDFAPNVVRAYRLIREMDVPAYAAALGAECVLLEHAAAADVARVLIDQMVSRSTPQVPNAPPLPRAPRITPDMRTNMVILTGTPAQLARAKTIVAKLDVRIHPTPPDVHLLRLSNIAAEPTAAALQQLIRSAPALWRAAGPRGPTVQVVAHAESNSLLVCAHPREFQKVRELVSALDVEPLK